MHAVDDLCFIDFLFSIENEELKTTLVGFVHSYNSQFSNAIGVDFPSAAVLRVLGPPDAMKAFSASTGVRRLASMCGGGLRVSAVPSGCPLVSVSRDNASDRNKPSHARRIARRAEARGGEMSTLVRKADASEVRLSLTSISNRHNFQLRVKRRTFAGTRAVAFNSYGLCAQGGVPQF